MLGVTVHEGRPVCAPSEAGGESVCSGFRVWDSVGHGVDGLYLVAVRMSRKGLHRPPGMPKGGHKTERAPRDRRECDWCKKLCEVASLCRDIMEGPDGPLVCRDQKACAKRARRKK